jgi:hypothetical protein
MAGAGGLPVICAFPRWNCWSEDFYRFFSGKGEFLVAMSVGATNACASWWTRSLTRSPGCEPLSRARSRAASVRRSASSAYPGTIAGIGLSLVTIIIRHATFCIVVVYNNVIALARERLAVPPTCWAADPVPLPRMRRAVSRRYARACMSLLVRDGIEADGSPVIGIEGGEP